jgi:hypothetical protein
VGREPGWESRSPGAFCLWQILAGLAFIAIIGLLITFATPAT